MRRRRRRKKRYKTGIYQSLKGGPCKYRSGWELAYMKYMDVDPNVVSFMYETLEISYVSNVRTGRTRKYLPDFYVTYIDGHVDVIEIKPSKRLNNAVVIKKSAAAIAWCESNGCTYKIVTEQHLKSLGIF